MKKLLSILLICSILVTPCLTVSANDLVADSAPASSKTETGATRSTVVVYQVNNKKQEKKSNELVELKNDFENGGYKPSKWEITKYLAKWFGFTFINDLKSYVMTYPLFKVSQLFSFLALYFPTYGFYKVTGIDIPANISGFLIKMKV